MPGGVKMFRGVPIGRGIAAPYMSARQTEPQVDPGRTGLQALLTAVRARNDVGINLTKMRTFLTHESPFAQLLSSFYQKGAGMVPCVFRRPLGASRSPQLAAAG